MFHTQRPLAFALLTANSPFRRYGQVSLAQRHSRVIWNLNLTRTASVRNLHWPRRQGDVLSSTSTNHSFTHQHRYPVSILPTFTRLITSSSEPRRRSAFVHYCLRLITFAGFFGLTVTAFIIAFFIYDATTYKENSEHEPVPIPELALHPRRGGPKNLPIADFLVDDDDDPEKEAMQGKPRLVVLGAGWGVSFSQTDPIVIAYGCLWNVRYQSHPF